MKILTVNDDGINAKGIRELTKALSDVADIYVFAPTNQRSASGHGISINSPLTVTPCEVDSAVEAYAVDGSPADCTKLGLHLLAERGVDIDLVFSGINHGGNLGTDTLYSGTVSAAIEGNLCGKPAVAVSINDHYPQHFEYACELAAHTAGAMLARIENVRRENRAFELQNATLNINVPNIPYEQIKGVKRAVLGPREYNEWFTKSNAGNVIAYKYSAVPVVYDDLPEDTDVMLIQNGYATITPLCYNLTDYALLKMLDILGHKN